MSLPVQMGRLSGMVRVALCERSMVIRLGVRWAFQSEAEITLVEQSGICSPSEPACDEAAVDIGIFDPVDLASTTDIVSVQELWPKAALVAYSFSFEQEYLRGGMRLGIRGFVSKNSSPHELIRAVRAVVGGKLFVDPEVTESLMTAVSPRSVGAQPGLSDREAQVLKLAGQGHVNKEIAATLGVSTKTVEKHRANAMAKLQLRSRADIIGYAATQGWIRPKFRVAG